MCSLTITDAAYSWIRRELAGSSVESPIVSLVQSAEATLPPFAMLRPVNPGASGSDVAGEHGGAPSTSRRWKLVPGVYSRADVPPKSQALIRGIWFSFSPEWQQHMKGLVLDAVGDTLVLKDAAGKVVLPIDPGTAGGA